jgi:2-keto-4-pentenoate hydratase/2-oxohepta-3-ene-1,7-dioic acid hydratase in catechol pathway
MSDSILGLTYKHQFVDQHECGLPTGKVVCVGRNYAAHAKELNNPVPTAPILFIKPSTALTELENGITLPRGQGECHYETEIAVLIGQRLKSASKQEVKNAITGIGIGLDLTLRDIQSRLKEKGHPWEQAKAFDGSCPLSMFVPFSDDINLQSLDLFLDIDGQRKQTGQSADMLTPILPLIAEMSRHFTLLPGDVVLTGTPAGVGPLESGMKLHLGIEGICEFEAEVK